MPRKRKFYYEKYQREEKERKAREEREAKEREARREQMLIRENIYRRSRENEGTG